MMTVNGMKRSFLDRKLIFILRKVASVHALVMIKKTNAMLFNEELEIFQPFKHGQHACFSCQFVLLVRFEGLTVLWIRYPGYHEYSRKFPYVTHRLIFILAHP